MARIVEAVPDCLLFDTAEKLALEDYELLARAGFRGGLRYVGFNAAPEPEDIDAEEMDAALSAGLGMMIVQHVREGLWTPSAALGASDAVNGMRHAKAAEYMDGATFWDDLESIAGTAAQTIDYANTKFAGVESAGNVQGEYIGDDVPLTGQQLYSDLLSPIYWEGLSRVPDVVVRGYAMRQVATVLVAGRIEVDINWHAADKKGGRAFWMRAA